MIEDEILDDSSFTDNSIHSYLNDTMMGYVSRVSALEEQLSQAVYEKEKAELKLLQLSKTKKVFENKEKNICIEEFLNEIKSQLEDLRISPSDFRKFQKASDVSFPNWVRMKAFDTYANDNSRKHVKDLISDKEEEKSLQFFFVCQCVLI
jgi:hypothetical protein